MTDTDVAMIGAGFGGLGAAIRLHQKGFTDFLIFEKADEIGGTWRDNTYPGCACDVPSHLYSYLVRAQSRVDGHVLGPAGDLGLPAAAASTAIGVRPQLRLGHEIEDMSWDEPAQRWVLTTSRGVFRARVVIVATGPLSEPSTPDIPGLETFAGTVFHSARWRHDHDLERARGGRHRHRRVGDPVRAADPAGGGQAAAVPAHAALDHAAPRRAASPEPSTPSTAMCPVRNG